MTYYDHPFYSLSIQSLSHSLLLLTLYHTIRLNIGLMSEQDDTASSVYENTNGMPMSNGKNLHMEIGPGEIANR